MKKVQMKKYKINWLVVLRNIIIVMLISVCYAADLQIKTNEIKLQELDNELALTHIISKHSYLSKLNHKVYTYIPQEEKPVKTNPDAIAEDKIYLGNFKITHYCACKKCCGPNAQGITASGKRVQEGVTIAVDPKVIKLGSKVKIADYGEYEAQDTGSAIKGNKIDVYIADHQRALNLGVVYKDVWLLK